MATPQNFILNFGTRDYVRDITPYAYIWADRFSGNKWNITLSDFSYQSLFAQNVEQYKREENTKDYTRNTG